MEERGNETPHGMARARGWGKRSVTFQIKLTAIAVNLKRIAAIIAKQEAKSGANALSAAAINASCNGILYFLPNVWLNKEHQAAI